MILREHPTLPLLVSDDGTFLFVRRRGQWVQHAASSRDGLYLSVRLFGKSRRVHRLVLESFVGLSLPGMVTRHLNGNHRDNRIENLAWGTRLENHRDMLDHGTSPRGERHGQAKLTAHKVREARRLLSLNVPQTEVARKFGVSVSAINQMAKRRTWKWLK